MSVTPHPELPGFYNVNSWSFTLEDDGDVEYVDEAIEAWTEWREFLLRREVEDQLDPLIEV